jgi:hypothetical protein
MNQSPSQVEIIVSPKSLERQIKLLDERLLELQSEVAELEKKREACHVLLGIPVAPVSATMETLSAPVKKAPPRKKREAEFSDEDEVAAVEPVLADSAEEDGAHAAH